MIVQPKASRSHHLLLAILASAGLIAACGPSFYEIPIETPIQPKLDVSAFQRVLVTCHQCAVSVPTSSCSQICCRGFCQKIMRESL